MGNVFFVYLPSPDIRGCEAIGTMTVREPRLAGAKWKRLLQIIHIE